MKMQKMMMTIIEGRPYIIPQAVQFSNMLPRGKKKKKTKIIITNNNKKQICTTNYLRVLVECKCAFSKYRGERP